MEDSIKLYKKKWKTASNYKKNERKHQIMKIMKDSIKQTLNLLKIVKCQQENITIV